MHPSTPNNNSNSNESKGSNSNNNVDTNDERDYNINNDASDDRQRPTAQPNNDVPMEDIDADQETTQRTASNTFRATYNITVVQERSMKPFSSSSTTLSTTTPPSSTMIMADEPKTGQQMGASPDALNECAKIIIGEALDIMDGKYDNVFYAMKSQQ
ncbi:unnamed protein product [Cylindrotheca closterium]|uniref:Uncharacterized protein n=1 Tax=Cylindrotheca closterium TaxID=2856 RepID=A0AAD2FPI3_9STRA|nr:unnamed protein product [Cylindrotheca closterium]